MIKLNKISLIGVNLAKKDLVFTFRGPLAGKCDECKIRNVCFNLEPGKSYRIKEVKEQINPCFIYDTNKVSTIDVEEVENTYNVQNGKRLMEGSSMELRSMKCDYLTCPNIEKCNLLNLKGNKKIVVKKIIGKISCPKGYDMREVES
ncbi:MULTISPECIES: UPF0179 family protein [Ferroplasma]|jgi:hypothetical protein|uniref:UPF0179 protein FACI_IFERC00001G1278 n=2 Tax=Ferroplasma TaxID=74968 RepID=S0APR9_FERAC|nr:MULTISPECIES: UPF0179 family protein [Ferroplasma]AGO61258.1 hypothetical protein FACI_IFERC00001G1278 [Ferroplasma acidarmanus Fer1]ARD84210.1 hypothetical protein FAD_0288 [Ferroplasma acidiphilum]MCL4349328.1 UPF0179 family protein [Candidatus Thermoplasmatota archaeon]WMT53117.1 MAG: UPF0179 family protein [Ferroplasma acidiphilum]